MVHSSDTEFMFALQVSKVELTFKQIIGNYRKQPHCRSQFFLFVSSNHEVYLFVHLYIFFSQPYPSGSPSSLIVLGQKNGGQDVGIVAFYNKIFVPSVESLLDILHAESPKQVPENNTGMLATYFSPALFSC